MLIKVKVRICVVRELDMNRVPTRGEAEEEWAVAPSAEEEEEESCINNGGTKPRKKLRLSKDQSRLLEESFRLNHTLNPVSLYLLFIFYYYYNICGVDRS